MQNDRDIVDVILLYTCMRIQRKQLREKRDPVFITRDET
jgi:hypothetical protein